MRVLHTHYPHNASTFFSNMSKRQQYAKLLLHLRRHGGRLREQFGSYNFAPGAKTITRLARTTLTVIHEAREDEEKLREVAQPLPELRFYPPPRQAVIPQGVHGCASGLSDVSGETSSCEYAARVQFALRDAIPGIHGIPLYLLLDKSAETFAPYIKDADARILTELVSEGIFAVPLEVRWPAYPGFVFRRMIQIANVQTQEPYTRLQVGHILANVLAMFVMEARCEGVSTNPWDAAYRFGPGGLAFEGLWLVSLWHVGSNTFEAELRYSEPPCN